MSLGAAMAGGNPREGRQDGDFYPTPAEVTHALLAAERFPGPIDEPAAGNGAMARVLEDHGYTVHATDIAPQGYGTQADFLERTTRVGESIITNPPFALAERFISHAMEVLKPRRMALVLKSTFWQAKRRRALFERFTPSAIYGLTWRPDFLAKGAPTMDVIWTVWDENHRGDPSYRLLHKPAII